MHSSHTTAPTRRAVQFIFSQTSKVNTFDVRTLLLTLVSGAALLSAAKTVADAFVLYISPHRESPSQPAPWPRRVALTVTQT